MGLIGSRHLDEGALRVAALAKLSPGQKLEKQAPRVEVGASEALVSTGPFRNLDKFLTLRIFEQV